MNYNDNNNKNYENTFTATSNQNLKIENKEELFHNNQFCKYCGTKIKSNLNYCKNCGRSIVDEQIIHCVKCGFLLPANTEYCPKCGKKNKNSKKISNKRKKVVSLSVIIILILAVLGCASYVVLPEILASPYKIMEDGDYEKAYNKANYNEKKDVLYENLVAVCCEKLIEILKYPSLFELQNVWLDKRNDKIVLQIGTTNEYSEFSEYYCLFEYDKNDYKYKYYNSLSVGDFDKEEFENYDNSSEIADKLINNYTREKVKPIIENNSLKITNGMSERINKLNQENLLENIKLLSQVELLYPDD